MPTSDATHFVGDDCDGGHLDDMQANEFRDPVEPRKCKLHKWASHIIPGPTIEDNVVETRCVRPWCGKVKDEALSRRGKQSRNYGNRAELHVARTYGGTKIGQAGGPVDVRGRDWNTQVKTHRRPTPAEWRKVFAALSASTDRLPRLLLRFVGGPGVPPDDYFVVPAKAWLDWFGKDEDAA